MTQSGAMKSVLQQIMTCLELDGQFGRPLYHHLKFEVPKLQKPLVCDCGNEIQSYNLAPFGGERLIFTETWRKLELQPSPSTQFTGISPFPFTKTLQLTAWIMLSSFAISFSLPCVFSAIFRVAHESPTFRESLFSPHL